MVFGLLMVGYLSFASVQGADSDKVNLLDESPALQGEGLENLDTSRLDTRSIQKVKKYMIWQSMDEYQGKCPCPQSWTHGGGRCGRLSAYSRQRVKSLLCYQSDISLDMVNRFLQQRFNSGKEDVQKN